MRRKPIPIGLVLALVALCGFDTAHAQDDQPTPIEQDKLGYYRVELPGVPYRVYYETRLRYGWDPYDRDKDRYQRTPDEPQKYHNYDKVWWDVTAPESYDRRLPAGLMVYVRQEGSGRLPEQWRGALDGLNLIFVSISSGRTTRPNQYTHAMAVHAVTLMRERYAIDTRRVYIAGHLNGAHVANAAAVLTPDVFRSAFMLFGGGYIDDLDLLGENYRGLAPDADRRLLRQSAGSSQLVYLNGQPGPERQIALSVPTAYQRAGFRNLTVWDEPGLGTTVPEAKWLADAVALFDQPLHRDAERAYERAVRDLERGRRDRGLAGLLEAAGAAPTAGFGDAAREQAVAMLAEYVDQVEAIESQIAAGAFDDATIAIDALKDTWGDLARADASRLEDTARAAERAARDKP